MNIIKANCVSIFVSYNICQNSSNLYMKKIELFILITMDQF
jgi:hypothetical protein